MAHCNNDEPSTKVGSRLSATSRIVAISDHSTCVRDSGGEGIPIVLVHALSMDSQMWIEHGIFDALATSKDKFDSSRRVLTYDLRGHGTADNAPGITSLPQLADDLRDVLKALSIEKIDVMGVSFGGGVSQLFALTYPELVRSAAFVATTATGSPLMADRATLAEKNGLESLVEPTLSRWFLPGTIAANAKCVLFARDRLSKVRVETWAAAWRAMAAIDCLHRLHELKIPILILASALDTSTTPEAMSQMAKVCKNAVYRLIDHGMHLFVIEDPVVASAELIAFRDSVDSL